MDSHRYADLVLEGGGVKGTALLGAVTVLAEHGYRFPRIAGTSAGAIVGSLAAAYQQSGREVSGLVTVMRELDYRSFLDATLLGRLGFLGEGLEVLLHDGIYPGRFAHDWIAGELAACGVRTWADLRDPDPDSALPPEQRYRLVVTAADLSRGQLVRLPWDYGRYGLVADEQPVADAVRASMSIPYYFRPVVLRGSRAAGSVSLVDGGLLSAFPIDIFDRGDGRPARWPTYGVQLEARPGAWQRAQPVHGPAKLTLAALRTLLGAHDAYRLADENTAARTIFVDTESVNGLDFGIDAATKQQLYLAGRRAAEGFVSGL